MSDPGPAKGDASKDTDLIRLMDEFADRVRGGERPSIEEYAERHPDLAPGIRELFPAILAVENMRRSAETPPSRPPPPPLSSHALPRAEGPSQRFADFRIVREIGRGGMGIVYEAVQESLGRRVALKLLPFHVLKDPRTLERFQREARAAATLQHPNIVSVYGVGEESGSHYYAMQYIEGQALDLVIADRHRRGGEGKPGAEEVARIGIQLADALSYAHGQGILHRDIKPSNLILDLQGKVWVTDFGLAKPSGSDDLTKSGEMVGTLPFMAPERFKGWCDPRSDIYSLGLVLYELLTLEPAFEDRDRSRLMRRILEEEPRRPRKLSPSIPRDLETIVLTAISKEPAHRYPAAAALADDLRRFLAGEPIAARSSGVLRRSAKWARRRPAAAALVALAILSTCLLLGGSLWYGDRLRRESIHTRANLEKALQAVEAMLTRVGDERLALVPQIEPVRRELLEEAVKYHEDFLKEDPKDPAIRLGVARAFARVAGIYSAIGQRGEGREALRRSIDLLEGLSREDPGNGAYATELRGASSLASLLESAALPPRGAEVIKVPVPGALNVVAVAAADIDGDGKLDLLTANRRSSDISVLSNGGGRLFTVAGRFPAGSGTYQIAVCDLDGDQRQDVLTIDKDSASVSVLAQEEKGKVFFLPPRSFSLGFEPFWLTIADMNRDGLPEAVVVGGKKEGRILRRDKAGTFALDPVPGMPEAPSSVVAGDLDGDGSADLAVGGGWAHESVVAVILSDGRGSFREPSRYPPGAGAHSLLCGDLDRDGDLDLVAVDAGGRRVSVLLNEGKGTFRQGARFEFGPNPFGIGLADLAGDGRLDLVTTFEGVGTDQTSLVSILLGDGRGNFPEVVRYLPGGYSFGGTIADIDGDGRLDIAVANGDTNDVAVMFHVAELLGLPGRKSATAGPASR